MLNGEGIEQLFVSSEIHKFLHGGSLPCLGIPDITCLYWKCYGWLVDWGL